MAHPVLADDAFGTPAGQLPDAGLTACCTAGTGPGSGRSPTAPRPAPAVPCWCGHGALRRGRSRSWGCRAPRRSIRRRWRRSRAGRGGGAVAVAPSNRAGGRRDDGVVGGHEEARAEDEAILFDAGPGGLALGGGADLDAARELRIVSGVFRAVCGARSAIHSAAAGRPPASGHALQLRPNRVPHPGQQRLDRVVRQDAPVQGDRGPVGDDVEAGRDGVDAGGDGPKPHRGRRRTAAARPGRGRPRGSPGRGRGRCGRVRGPRRGLRGRAQ